MLRHASLRAVLACGVVLTLGCGQRQEATPSRASATPVPDTTQWRLEWAQGATFYEIFVRSFADSNGDGIGDLPGLTAHLDYLNDGDPATDTDLGVEGIWLMPVFPSPSYHGYDATDYEAINPDYGTMEDFNRFLQEAHRRGIRVILDFMINHTSSQHAWFVDSSSGPGSPKRDWYVWRPDDPGWRQPWSDQGQPTWHEKNGAYYYGIFWGGMPDLNFRNPEVRHEIERIAKEWLDRGVDGFRLDAARHITADGPGQAQNDTPETHAFWREFSASVRRSHPGALLVGENWTDAEHIAPYYGATTAVAAGEELPMNFDFPLAEAILSAVRQRDAAPIAAAWADKVRLDPAGVLDGTFLTNHDMVRVATQLDDDGARLRSAASILLTLPGTPFVYYGEELGMLNRDVSEGDPGKRAPMAWDGSPNGGFTTGTPWLGLPPGRETRNVADELIDPGSMLDHYRHLIGLRTASPALRRGSLEMLSAADQPSSCLAYLRTDGDEHLLVVHNLSEGPAHVGPLAAGAHTVSPMWSSGEATAEADDVGVTVGLTAGASAIWRVE